MCNAAELKPFDTAGAFLQRASPGFQLIRQIYFFLQIQPLNVRCGYMPGSRKNTTCPN